MRNVLSIALLGTLSACADGPLPLPQAKGPMQTWNTSMWGVAAPPLASQTLPPGMPTANAAVPSSMGSR